MTNNSQRIRIFKYIPELDGFDVTPEYRMIAERLGLVEWNPVVWIGRLFSMDNDFGEHWFDNWDIKDQKDIQAKKMELNSDLLFFIDPDRFQDGRDGPCHSPEMRKLFWTSVLCSLELSLDLIISEARSFNHEAKMRLDETPADLDYLESYIPDIEDRISLILSEYEN